MRKHVKLKLLRFLREWVRPLLVIVVVVGSLRSAVADWNDVPTGSMKPTILEGDRIFVNKLAYDLKVPFTNWCLFEWEGPQRGDVIVFFSPESGERLVKRVVGAPGDRIALRNNRLYVNGERAEYGTLDRKYTEQFEQHLQRWNRFALEKIGDKGHPIMTISPTRRIKTQHQTFKTITVPEGHYFVMGDNRDRSRDSRWFGSVPRKVIAGRATAIAISFDPDRYYLPRWGRFFQELP